MRRQTRYKKASVVVVSQRREVQHPVQVFDQKHAFFFSLKTYKVTGYPGQEVPGGSPCNHVNVNCIAPQKKKVSQQSIKSFTGSNGPEKD